MRWASLLCVTQGVFWLGRPWLFRPVIKFLVRSHSLCAA